MAGTVLVAGLTRNAYAVAMVVLALIGFGGLVAAVLLPRRAAPGTTTPSAGTAAPEG